MVEFMNDFNGTDFVNTTLLFIAKEKNTYQYWKPIVKLSFDPGGELPFDENSAN